MLKSQILECLWEIQTYIISYVVNWLVVKWFIRTLKMFIICTRCMSAVSVY